MSTPKPLLPYDVPTWEDMRKGTMFALSDLAPGEVRQLTPTFFVERIGDDHECDDTCAEPCVFGGRG